MKALLGIERSRNEATLVDNGLFSVQHEIDLKSHQELSFAGRAALRLQSQASSHI